jgi:antitoxin (DNA-binding transcriptional repressor) of toxin-antitoxin stability system
MKKVNISYLRSHLRETVSCVKEGQSVLILDRETPVAKLGPAPAPSENGVLEELEKKGMVTCGRPRKKQLPPTVRLREGFDISAVLEDERDEPW